MYINKSLRILSVKEKDFMSSGSCGKVYSKSDEQIIKTYFKETVDLYKLNNDVFSIIKDIKSPNLIEIYDVYTSLIHYYKYLRGKTEFKVDAYAAKYYQGTEKNVLRDSKEYLLENMYGLEQLVHELSNSAILVGDLSRENTIFTESNMVIVDPDLFSHSVLSFKENQEENIISYLDYIAFLFIDELIKEEKKYNRDYSKLKKQIFLESIRIRKKIIGSDKSIVDELSKVLRFHKSPMEFFTKGE